MAKVFIEETTLTAIGDAIRGKEGSTELVPVNDMATRISALQTGSDPAIEALEITSNGTYIATDCDGYSPIVVNVPQDGAPIDAQLIITGDCSYRFANNGWNWVIEKYGNRITTRDITNCASMFVSSSDIREIPFPINIVNCKDLSEMFNGCNKLKVCPKIRGTIKWGTISKLTRVLSSCENLRDIEDLFLPEMLDGFSTVKVTNQSLAPAAYNLQSGTSLRQVPTWWYKFRLNPESTMFPYESYTIYNWMVNKCSVLDEVTNIPVWVCTAALLSNLFGYAFQACNRLKNITFETNSDGSPIEVQWKMQTIDLSQNVGYAANTTIITYHNSGITIDKEVKDGATYQALKSDPDWFTTNVAYSRYNHDSAVATINSLPDASAYLATQSSGTNTIKFTGASGELTDGGAINTLTEEEIAVAAAKGWTITFA